MSVNIVTVGLEMEMAATRGAEMEMAIGRAVVMEMEMATGRGANMDTTTLRGMSTATGMEVITGMSHEQTGTAADGWRRWTCHACALLCTVSPHFLSSLTTNTELRLETLVHSLSAALGFRNISFKGLFKLTI